MDEECNRKWEGLISSRIALEKRVSYLEKSLELQGVEKETVKKELRDKEAGFASEVKRLKGLISEAKEQALQNKVAKDQLEGEVSTWQLKAAEAVDNLERARTLEGLAREFADKQVEQYRDAITKLQAVSLVVHPWSP